jgi:hypothetical protein
MITPFVSTVNQADTCTLSGGTWSTSLPLASLQTSKLGDLARTLHETHGSTWFKVTAPSQLTSRVVALVRDNLTGAFPGVTASEVTEWRVRTIASLTGSPAVIYPRAQPVSILASSNFTGTVATLQEPDLQNKTGSWLTATSGTTNTDVRASLQASSCGLLSGAGAQTILVLVRRTAGGGSNPTCTVDLYHSGSLVANLVSATPVSSTTGTILTLTWNASLLGGSPPACSGIEIRVRGTASATATVEVGGIQWLPEFASNGSAEVTDSGWMTRTLPPAYWGPPRSTNQLYLLYLPDEDFIWDEQAIEFHAVDNYDDCFEAGLLVIGEASTFEDAFGNATYEDLGLVVRAVDPSLKERMRSGALDVDRRRGWKEFDFTFSGLSRTGAMDFAHEGIQRFLGLTRPALWVPRPEEPTRWSSTVVFGTLKSLGDVAQNQTAATAYSVSFTVEESV